VEVNSTCSVEDGSGVFDPEISSVGPGVSVRVSDARVAVGVGVLEAVGEFVTSGVSNVPVGVAVALPSLVGVGLGEEDAPPSVVGVGVGLTPPEPESVAVGTGWLAISARRAVTDGSPLSARASAISESCIDPSPLPNRSIP
jgi:hypothetical protein